MQQRQARRLYLIWGAIVATVLGAMWFQSSRQEDNGPPDGTVPASAEVAPIDMQAELAGKLVVLLEGFRRMAPTLTSELVLQNAAPLSDEEAPFVDRLAYTVLVGKVESWETAVEQAIARASAESQVDLLRDALVSVRTQVAASYLQVRTLQQQRAVLLANRDALVKSRDLVQERFDSGVTGRLDLARAEAELDGVEAEVPQVEAGLSSAVATLAVLCGANPAEIAPLVSAPASLPSAPDVAGVGLPEELLERRPDVRAARQRLLAATAAIGVAEAQHFPRLTVSGNFYIAANGIDGLGDISNKAYTIGPSLYLPLFTGGKIDSAVRQQRAQAEAALAQYRQAVITAVGDVSACASDFAQAIETRGRSDAALASARVALEIAESQYRAGVTDFSTLLDVQRAALNAESSAVGARAGVVQGYVALQRALGAGWSAEDEMIASAGKPAPKAREEKR